MSDHVVVILFGDVDVRSVAGDRGDVGVSDGAGTVGNCCDLWLWDEFELLKMRLLFEAIHSISIYWF